MRSKPTKSVCCYLQNENEISPYFALCKINHVNEKACPDKTNKKVLQYQDNKFPTKHEFKLLALLLVAGFLVAGCIYSSAVPRNATTNRQAGVIYICFLALKCH